MTSIRSHWAIVPAVPLCDMPSLSPSIVFHIDLGLCHLPDLLLVKEGDFNLFLLLPLNVYQQGLTGRERERERML